MTEPLVPVLSVPLRDVNAIVDAHPQRNRGDGDRDDVERCAGGVHQSVQPHNHQQNGHEGHRRLFGGAEADAEGDEHEEGAEDERGLHLVLHCRGGGKSGDGASGQHDPCEWLVFVRFAGGIVGAAGKVREHLEVAPHFCYATGHAGEVLGLCHSKANLHHVVGCWFPVDVQPGAQRVKVNNGHDVQLNDACWDVGNGSNPGHPVQREVAVEERQTIPVTGVHQRSVASKAAVDAVTLLVWLPPCRLKGRAVQHHAALRSKHHLVEGEDIDGAVGLTGDLVGHPIGQGVHVLAELVDGGEHPRVKDVAQDEQVGRFTFIGKSG